LTFWKLICIFDIIWYTYNPISGDFFTAPSKEYLESVINSNKSKFPIAYTIDIGVLENGDNVVVEYNDMWAIGNYGINNYDYFKLLRERYFEIVK